LQAEPELLDQATTYFREELGLSRTRIRARAVAKVRELGRLSVPLLHI
jgi:hypothetical protein